MIARHILHLAAAVMPAHRKEWGAAMLRELDATEPGLDALTFALGCLWAACSERISVMKLIVSVGRWGVGLVTMLYGALFLWGLINGLLHPEYVVWKGSGLTYLFIWQSLMGLGPLPAGYFLINWRPRAFGWSCLAMAVPALCLTLFGFFNSHHTPPARVLSYAWPFVPLLMLITAAAFLAWLDSGKPRNMAAA